MSDPTTPRFPWGHSPSLDAMAGTEGPLHRQLREIAEGRQALPVTSGTARRHWVPAFALASFTAPDGALHQLDTKTGQPSRTTPEATAAGDDPTPSVGLAAFFAVIEAHGADALRAFLAEPFELTPENRQTLAYFLALQYMRTPAALTLSRAAAQALMALRFVVGDATAFRLTYRATVDPKGQDPEIDALRRRLASRPAEDLEGEAFRLALRTADEVALMIASLEWHLLRASEDEFVTSDRPMGLHDPAPPQPWSGHALASSPQAETTFPLSPEHMLFLFRGEPRVGIVSVAADDVRELNLRTYAWTERRIFGRTQEAVARVRRQAKEDRRRLITPRWTGQVVLQEADPSDPTVGEEHARKGWPRGVMTTDADGSERFCTYTLIAPDDPSAVKDAIAEELDRSLAQ